MPASVAKPVSEDTLAGRMYEVYDFDEFCEWCADSTTWKTLGQSRKTKTRTPDSRQ
jgi:hypothetical protein